MPSHACICTYVCMYVSWDEYKTDEGAVYYYDSVLNESSWEHLSHEYYRCVCMRVCIACICTNVCIYVSLKHERAA